MLTPNEILQYLSDIESDKIERTISVTNTDKFCEAICAFSNDISGNRSTGYLFIGVYDDGSLSGLKASDILLRNLAAIRSEGSNAPIKFYEFADRLEIINPGGLYGNARPENFPTVNDYRNPIVAEAMKVLGYVNKYNRGIYNVQAELVENGTVTGQVREQEG